MTEPLPADLLAMAGTPPSPGRAGARARANGVLKAALWVLLVLQGAWAVEGAMRGLWGLALIDGGCALGAALLLAVPRLGFRTRAHLTGALFFIVNWATLMLVEGIVAAHAAANHLWFIGLAVAAVLVLADEHRSVVTGYVVVCLLSFLAVEFGVVRFEPIAPVPAEFHATATNVVWCLYFATVVALMAAFLREVDGVEHQLADDAAAMERILGYMLPQKISERLRREGKTFADGYLECSVMFADLVGFDKLSRHLPAAEIVLRLNEIFSAFDDLCTRAGIEKIKTIGDAYMVAAGIPDPRPDHARALARLALEFQEATKHHAGIALRIGIHSGPVVAGVIGKKRFIYDLWGDTVNVASRMKSHGVAGQVQLSEATFQRLGAGFVCQPRGEVPIKGHRPMHTYMLLGLREEAHDSAHLT
jgi:class 3 adenylate cyclase